MLKYKFLTMSLRPVVICPYLRSSEIRTRGGVTPPACVPSAAAPGVAQADAGRGLASAAGAGPRARLAAGYLFVVV